MTFIPPPIAVPDFSSTYVRCGAGLNIVAGSRRVTFQNYFLLGVPRDGWIMYVWCPYPVDGFRFAENRCPII